jgi:hypothetical protein
MVGQTWYSQAIADARKHELSMGLEKVTDPKEIESHRWDTDDDNWGASPDAPNKIEWSNL